VDGSWKLASSTLDLGEKFQEKITLEIHLKKL